ncbi:hypothetical protein ACHAXA_008574 [Cyclostephanos tholiformis]|uniref:RING-type domain-containing protein n=1 Tax=Cyclostephanos tholiformis TaxID=382380 RepID=A0ABD3SPQ9_9STRA
MSSGDVSHPVNCPTSGCDYNFCLDCLTALSASSMDDYAMVRDRNHHVKVKLACPNCRSDISSSILGTIGRRRDSLREELRNIPDGELSTGKLRRKHGVHNVDDDDVIVDDNTNRDDIDVTLFGGLNAVITDVEGRYITGLMTSGRPDLMCTAATILCGLASMLREGQTIMSTTAENGSNVNRRPNVDTRHGYSSTGVTTRANN